MGREQKISPSFADILQEERLYQVNPLARLEAQNSLARFRQTSSTREGLLQKLSGQCVSVLGNIRPEQMSEDSKEALQIIIGELKLLSDEERAYLSTHFPRFVTSKYNNQLLPEHVKRAIQYYRELSRYMELEKTK